MKTLLVFLMMTVPACGQVAKLSAPETVKAGQIAVIDTSGSVGDRFDFNVVPAVPDGSLVRDEASKLLYFATARAGTYLLVLTAYEGDVWAIKYSTLTVAGDPDPFEPDEPPDDDQYGLVAATAKDCPAEGRDEVRKFFTGMVKRIRDDKLLSRAIDDLLHEAAEDWPDAWTGDEGHYTLAIYPLIIKAKLKTPAEWARAYADIARGIPQ